MKTLGKYEKFEDPILLRKDFVKNHQGHAYIGSKMKEPSELFRTPGGNTANTTYTQNNNSTVQLKSRFKRPLSSVGTGGEKETGNYQGSLNSRPITSYIQQIKGQYQFQSSNTLRNSVLPQTIPKATRFREEPKGSQFAEFKDPVQVQTAAPLGCMTSGKGTMSAFGKTIMEQLPPQNQGNNSLTRQTSNISPITKLTAANSSFHVKRDTLSIKVDEYIARGRPLWMRELQVGAPAPNAYKIKTAQELEGQKIETKPNKCLFGEPYEKFKKTCDIEPSVKIYDHSQHYASTTLGFYRSDPNIISPMDTLVTRKKNHPVISMAQSKEILFKDVIERGKNSPGPADYNQDDSAVRDNRNIKITIPNQPRVTDFVLTQTPGPGAYETESLTNLARKVELKNSIHQTYSETLSLGSKSTKSTSTLSRPTSKYAMLKYFEKSRSSTSQSWFQIENGGKEKEPQRRNTNTGQLLTQQFQNNNPKIEEDSRDMIDEEELTNRFKSIKHQGSVTLNSAEGRQQEKLAKAAPWRANNEFIQFVQTLDDEHRQFMNSQPILLHSRTALPPHPNHPERRKRSKQNRNQARASNATESANRLIYLGTAGNGSIKSLGGPPKSTNANAFSHKDFI